MSQKGRWTYRIIPGLKDWLARAHGEVNFFSKKLVSGHGCFRSYLHRFRHATSPECAWCANGEDETAEHVLFRCGRFYIEREHLEAELVEQISVSNLVPMIIRRKENWEAFNKFAAIAMTELRRVEQLSRT
ncbi:uncharacterized protein [Drosophila tropicalis]|uniref:uncharacterized protein n=1 Tax=Drosophila tropicalis TaxID=46794 RepID=UPI0035AB9B25